jgi:microcystin-dependent protein
MAECYLGQIQAFGFNFAPKGWALCNGQLLPIAQNAALFSLLGTFYGGNGVQTFALPNLQGRFPLHWGSGAGLPPYVIGEFSGTPSQTLLVSNMPIHNHALNASSASATTENPGGNFPATANDPATFNPISVYGPTANTTLNPTAIGIAGGSQPLSIMPPYLAVTFCIAMNGIFPSRN